MSSMAQEEAGGALGSPGVAALTAPLTLRDGMTVVHVRPIAADDEERLRDFHAHLSADTIVMRFFRYVPELSEQMANEFTHLDYSDRMALVATASPDPEEPLLAVVRYSRTSATRAEVAFVIADAWQGRGIGTALLLRLARYARGRGITTFFATTLAANARMLDVFRHCGFPHTVRYQDGEYEITLDIRQDPHQLLGPISTTGTAS